MKSDFSAVVDEVAAAETMRNVFSRWEVHFVHAAGAWKQKDITDPVDKKGPLEIS